jgi:L-alanine-DL-glutamate epimerase-like enolase superfamily enzyme
VGGITESKRVVELAASRERLVVPHCWKTGISIAASVHLATAAANCPFTEYLPADLSESELRRELVENELKMEDGYIVPSNEPGLGIELNDDAMKKYRVA